MLVLAIAGVITTITLLITMQRFVPIRRILGYAAVVDVGFTILMFCMFFGTFGGIVSGAFAGLFMTLILSLMRAVLGFERASLRLGPKRRWRGLPVPRRAYLEWKVYPARINLGLGDLFKREAWL